MYWKQKPTKDTDGEYENDVGMCYRLDNESYLEIKPGECREFVLVEAGKDTAPDFGWRSIDTAPRDQAHWNLSILVQTKSGLVYKVNCDGNEWFIEDEDIHPHDKIMSHEQFISTFESWHPIPGDDGKRYIHVGASWVEIPAGYEHLTEGRAQKSDKSYDVYEARWCEALAGVYGDDIEGYKFGVIRPIKPEREFTVGAFYKAVFDGKPTVVKCVGISDRGRPDVEGGGPVFALCGDDPECVDSSFDEIGDEIKMPEAE